jgi:S-adenosylmethionine:tRNA ribosyltransferase-isomerase
MDRATGKVCDRHFADILEYVVAGDCLVLNNTKVLPARFFAHRPTGAKLEGLFLGETRDGLWEVMVKGAGKIKAGQEIVLRDKAGTDWRRVRAVARISQGRWLFDVGTTQTAGEILEKIGFAPLPPYIKRSDDNQLAKARRAALYKRTPGAIEGQRDSARIRYLARWGRDVPTGKGRRTGRPRNARRDLQHLAG